jgi:cytidylate kinase
VTLAALHGTEGNLIGPRVAERLGVAFLDRPIPHTVAQDGGVSEQAIAETDESPRTRWDRVIDTLARGSPPTGASPAPERVDLQQRRLQAEIEASRFGGVVLGRGGAVVLATVPGALHVFLGGSLEARVERIMGLEGMSREAATQHVTEHDRARYDYVRSTYGIEGNDPTLYHLMIDAVTLGVDTCVDLIVSASESYTRRGRAQTA